MKNLDSELIYVISISLLLALCLIITFKSQGNNKLAKRFLVFYFWFFFYAALITYVVLYNYVIYVPHLFRTTFLTWFLVMPCSYMFLVQTLYPRPLRRTDLLHLLPFLIYLIDYFPFFLLPAHEKLSLLKNMDLSEIRIGFTEGWFMPRLGHYVIRMTQIMFYLIAQSLIIIKVSRSGDHPVMIENPLQFNWLKLMVGSQFLMFLGPLFATLILNGSDVGMFSNLTALLVSIIQCYFLVFHPELLYGAYFENVATINNGIHTVADSDPLVVYNQKPNSNNDEERRNYYPGQALNEISIIIEKLMADKKPYLQARYKLTDLADETGIGVNKISAAINQIYQMNFYSYLNKYRVEYFLAKLANNEHQSKTLEALAEECGFQSRSTFIRAFKSKTGFNPSEYLARNSVQMTK